jgi:hypothetical protein
LPLGHLEAWGFLAMKRRLHQREGEQAEYDSEEGGISHCFTVTILHSIAIPKTFRW